MKNEPVMVVSREKLFGKDNKRFFEGFKPVDDTDFIDIITDEHTFMMRPEAEENPNFLQIIPYILIRKKDKFFVMRYLEGSNEKRHVDQYNLGVGGHINPVEGSNVLIAGAEKEFFEEVNCKTKFNPQILGFINHEIDMYNKVHFGVVFLQDVNQDIDINEEEKHKMAGEMLTIPEMKAIYNKFGFWSKSILDNIETFL